MDQNSNTPKQVPENPRFKRMQEEVQQMYDIFKKEVDIDTVMNESEFEKYKPLYQKSTMPEGRPMTFDEVANLAELSQEYYHRINPQRPVHIVNDYTGEEEFVLPPIYNRLRPLTGEQAGIMDIYSNVHSTLQDASGPIVEAKKDTVDNMLLNDYIKAQSRADLAAKTEQFNKLATEFHKKVFGDNPFAKNAEGSAVTKEEALAKNKPTNESIADDGPDADFEF